MKCIDGKKFLVNHIFIPEGTDDIKTKEENFEITTKVIEESSSTLEVSETHTSKVEESKITLEQTVTVSETSSEKVIELQKESSSHFSSGM